MDADLNGTTVLVTGASGGIGAACARALAAEGARVALHGHRHAAAARELADELPGPHLAVTADVSRPADVDAMMDQVVGSFGHLDAVVANAGIWPPEPAPIHRMDVSRWQQVMDVNLTGVFLVARGFFAHLARRRPETASLVLVGSTAAAFGEEGHAAYAAAKAGLTYGLTRTLKNEIIRLAPRGRVNTVAPGWTRTAMAEPGLDNPGTVDRVMATRSLRSVAEPEEIARAVVFLTSHALAGHITGQILTVAGGMEGRLIHEPA